MDIVLYDTTLRDGAQREGLSLSLEDKLHILDLLDEIGIPYVEGGFPSSNPKDSEFFRQAAPKHAKLVAFGSTRRAGVEAGADAGLRALLGAETPAVAFVGKSSASHVVHVLGTTLEENLEMIRDSVALAKRQGREVIFDAEHFFDGLRANRAYALTTLRTAAEAGADWIVLCDTNGGSLPSWVASGVGASLDALREFAKCRVGVHAHNDSELAVANSLAATEVGATMIQGTLNGWGERCGNANLSSIIPTLILKLGKTCLRGAALERMTEVSHRACEIANVAPDPFAPYVGSAAFAHKAGLHAAAVDRLEGAYEHVKPESVGNVQRVLVSELSGRGNMRARARALGLELGDVEAAAVLTRFKEMELRGFQLEAADGTVELVMRRAQSGYVSPFQLADVLAVWHTDKDKGMLTKASVQVDVGGDRIHSEATGHGPVDALDHALRGALVARYPEIDHLRLVDYKVRILDPELATAATTRVLLEATHDGHRWITAGCSDNIIEASCVALLDSFELCVLRRHGAPARDAAEVTS